MSTELFDAALRVRLRAYAPYSGFCVGAAVRGGSGAIYAACNVENAAYPVGQCAEAGAMSAAISAGETRIVEALVVADSPEPVTPCGACRQRLNEFSDGETPIHVANLQGEIATFRLEDLLPLSFGPANLARKASPEMARPPRSSASGAEGLRRVFHTLVKPRNGD